MTKIRDDAYLTSLGEKIREIRTGKAISTYQLSYDSDVSRSQITSIENGSINTSICTLKALADALNVKVGDFLE